MVRRMNRVTDLLARVPAWVQDGALAAALTGFTQWEIGGAPFIEGAVTDHRVTFAVMTAAVAGRRIAPLAAATVGAAGLSAQTIWGGDAVVVGGFLAMILLTHSVALYSELAAGLAGLAAVLLAVHTYTFVNLDEFRLADEIGNSAIFVFLWALGRSVRARQAQRTEAETRAAAAEASREQHARDAVSEERARIARELHDIVAHGVSNMVVQTGAARQVLASDPDRARESLLTVESSGRQALEEMQRLLGVLRRVDSSVSRSSEPDLGRIDALIAQGADAGLQIETRTEGEPRPVAPSVASSAFRIVQESITNCIKHAPGSSVTVVLRYRADGIEIDVTDDGAAVPPTPGPGGFGLLGMRERAQFFGGTFDAGPRPAGGWRVRALIPTALVS